MNNKKRLSIVALALAMVVLISTAVAYFTDIDTVDNVFTIGEVEIGLEEPDWTPEEHTQITPNQTIEKDPTITNTGINDAFVFLTVEVPYKNIVTADVATGVKKAAADTELFTYALNSGWIEIGTPVKDAEKGTVTHLYAYGTASACTALASGAEAAELFSTVTFVNAIEDQGLEKQEVHIPIKAYAIQTTDLTDNDVTTPDEVWKLVAAQNEVKGTPTF